jgi:membrane associated rhomboid family serine protease
MSHKHLNLPNTEPIRTELKESKIVNFLDNLKSKWNKLPVMIKLVIIVGLGWSVIGPLAVWLGVKGLSLHIVASIWGFIVGWFLADWGE